MAFPTGAPPAEATSDESKINDLLGADLGSTETAERVEEDTSMADSDIVVEDEQLTEGAEPITEEPTDDVGEEGEAGTSEDEFNVSDLETDYSDSAYAKAAEHFNKRRTRPLDPNDADDRWILKELMDRGRKIEDLQATTTEETTEGAEAKPAEPEKPAEPAKVLTPMERVQQAEEYAKTQIVPEVAMKFSKGVLDALWPGKEIAFTQEQANALAQTFSTFAIMQIADALPSVFAAIPDRVSAAFPFISQAQEMAMKETVASEFVGAKTKEGAAQYPGFVQLAESGTIKRIRETDLKGMVFDKDPVKNFRKATELAYKMARGLRPDPKMLENAARRGAERATERSRAVAAGRLPSGRSKGGFAAGASQQDSLKAAILGVDSSGNVRSGNKFSRALAESRANREQ